MFAFPRSFFFFWLDCVVAVPVFFVDDEMKERLYDSLLFFFSLSLSSLFFSVLTIRRRLLPPHHHQLQDDQINAVYTNSIVFSFFFSIRRPCSCGEAFVYIYTYIECIRVFLSSYEIADPDVHLDIHIQGHQHVLISFCIHTHVLRYILTFEKKQEYVVSFQSIR